MKLFELYHSRAIALLEGITHVEDLIISDGAAGAETALKELSGLSKSSESVTLKWDGSVALVFGRDGEGNLVLVDKHMFDKIAKGREKFKSMQEYDAARGHTRSSLWEVESVLLPILQRVVPAVKDKYWMGDFMWSGTPSVKDGYYTFKPNTVEYQVKIDSELGDTISRSASGIALHTFINGLGASDVPLTGLKGLKDNGGITWLLGEIKNKPRIILQKELLAQTKSVISMHKAAVDKFFDDLTQMKSKSVLSAMGPFITSMLDENDVSNNIVPRFLAFLKNKLNEKQVAKLLGANQDGWLYQADGGGPGLLGVWSMWAAITELKLNIKTQIDAQQQGSEVRAIVNNQNSHEGYVFGSGDDKLKIIDRLGFSRANFSKFRPSDEEVQTKSKMPLAAFCFGRMNPPTLGHKALMDATVNAGGTNSYIFLSNSHDGDSNPLDPSTKAAFIKKIYPRFAGHVVDEYIKGPIDAANWLYKQGFRNIAFVGGSDRLGNSAGSIEKLLNGPRGWNSGAVRTNDSQFGNEGREHVHMSFISSGARDADVNSLSGISGSLARKYAEEGNQKGFESATGVGNNVKVNGKSLYDATRAGMGLAEITPITPITPAPAKAPPKVKPVPKEVPKKKQSATMEGIRLFRALIERK